MNICLNMIVKNEAGRIARCLASVAPYISAWAILDTGSDDGTPDLVNDFFRNRRVAGYLDYEPFKDFSTTRNVALEMARSLDCDYILLADADMELVHGEQLYNLTAPAYQVVQRGAGLTYWNTRLVRRGLPCKYVGVTHEYLDTGVMPEKLHGVWFRDHMDGANRPGKTERDRDLLLADVRSHPDNARSWFYLGNAHKELGQFAQAADAYAKRIALGGWQEEVWRSRLEIARCFREMKSEPSFEHNAVRAYNERPWRAEPLHDLAKFYRDKSMHAASVMYAKQGRDIPKPAEDLLFIEDFPYDWGFREELSICGYYAHSAADKALGYECCEELALSREAPAYLREQAWRNLFFYTRPLREQAPSCQLQRIGFTPPDGYHPLNPSICRLGDRMVVNVRAVNYLIGGDGRYVMPPDGVVRTRNFLLSLANDTLVVEGGHELHLPPDLPKPVFDQCLGFEDVRLFPRGNELWCSATTRQIDPQGWCDIVTARIGNDGQMTNWCVIRPEGQRRAEKNWMPVVDSRAPLWIYSCDPVRLLRDHGGNAVSERPAPVAASEFGGSSQAVPFKITADNERTAKIVDNKFVPTDLGYLCLIHERQAQPDPMRGQRNYQRRFVWFDQDFNMRRISRRFTFTDGEGEFCCGMCWHPDGRRLVISYGVLDREAWLATVDADEVRAMLREVDNDDRRVDDYLDKRRPANPSGCMGDEHSEVGDGLNNSVPVSGHIGGPDPGDRVGQPAVAVEDNQTILTDASIKWDDPMEAMHREVEDARRQPASGYAPEQTVVETLGYLFRKYGTDKDVNGYTPFYEELFGDRRAEVKAVLEIGIGTMDPNAPYSMVGYAQEGYRPGGSLRAWRDWFPNAEIMGLDRQPDCLFSEDRITTALGDSTYNFNLPGHEFDIIVDDGNHSVDAQLKTLENCLPLLREGGTYVVEDIVWDSAYASRLHDVIGVRPWRLSGPHDNLMVIENRPWKAVGPERVSPSEGIEPWLDRNTNAVLRSEADLQYAIDAVKHNGWPVHPDRTKHWDCYVAVRHVLKHASRSEYILDAGADQISSFLPTLAHIGYSQLLGLNLLGPTTTTVASFQGNTKKSEIYYQRGNIEATGLRDNHFAFVACLSTIEHGVNIERFLKEAARILKPGGHLFISTDYWPEPIDTRIEGWRIFTADSITRLRDTALLNGLWVVGNCLDLTCNERVCHHKGDGWGGDYTFINLLFRKGT